MVDTVFTITAYTLMGATLTGWVTFRVLYKPWRSSGHSKTGQHLIRTADSMIALLGVSLLQVVVPIPLPIMQAVTLLVLGWLCWVAWERVHLRKWERRRRLESADDNADDNVEDTA